MHDIDRALFEMEQQEQMEQMEGPGGHEMEGELNETLEMELAAELLEVSNEAELEQFLGKLFGRAVGAVKTFANSSAGRAAGGLLKGAARQVLPRLGQIVGDYVSPGGGQIGASIGRYVGSRLELEGLSNEDREFEVARAFVRFADETLRQAAAAPTSVPAAQAAVRAATLAAQHQLPPMVGVVRRLTPPGAGGTGQQASRRRGTWTRQGLSIVLHNVV